jgi:hypothetical protein
MPVRKRSTSWSRSWSGCAPSPGSWRRRAGSSTCGRGHSSTSTRIRPGCMRTCGSGPTSVGFGCRRPRNVKRSWSASESHGGVKVRRLERHRHLVGVRRRQAGSGDELLERAGLAERERPTGARGRRGQQRAQRGQHCARRAALGSTPGDHADPCAELRDTRELAQRDNGICRVLHRVERRDGVERAARERKVFELSLAYVPVEAASPIFTRRACSVAPPRS